MRQPVITLTLAAVISASSGLAWAGPHEDPDTKRNSSERQKQSVQLGPRPFFLVNDMRESELKEKLLSCSARLASCRRWSIWRASRSS